MYTQKEFDRDCASIKKTTDALGDKIHAAGLFALEQANQHGNIGPGQRLLDALGKKHATKRVKAWLVNFGKFGVKDGILVFKNRKDINEETMDSAMAAAAATPWYDLTAEPKGDTVFDVLGQIKSVLRKYEHAVTEGKKTDHDELVNGLRGLLPVEAAAK